MNVCFMLLGDLPEATSTPPLMKSLVALGKTNLPDWKEKSVFAEAEIATLFLSFLTLSPMDSATSVRVTCLVALK